VNRFQIKIAPLILLVALAAAGCQELSVNVEPGSSAPTPAQTQAAASSPAAGTPVPTQAAATVVKAAPTATAIPGHLQPGAAVRLAEIHMVDANQGWALGNRGLGLVDVVLRTADDGQTWRDVTPPLPAAENNGTGKQATGAFFDAQHAWVSYADLTPAPDLKNPLVWYTADGGANWQSSQPLDLQNVQVEGYNPGLLGFLDLQHGWLLAHVGAGMNHDYVVIFTTGDGGRTWTRMVDPEKNNLAMSCHKTGLVFKTPQLGYLAGDCQGVAPGIYLSRTVDGGVTWSDVLLPAPDGKPADFFKDPTVFCGVDTVLFPSAQDAFIPVRCSTNGDPKTLLRWLYASQDGGQSFHSLPVPAQYGSINFLNPQTGWLIGSFTIDAVHFTLFGTVDGGQNWKSIANLGWTGMPDFVDAQNGWVVAKTGDVTALVHTTDGGASWQEIKPLIAP
jgi:photosystem II stability/assembly factor-like uncharacterized protein